MIDKQLPFPKPLPGQVHIWLADLRQWLSEKGSLLKLLSWDELRRLERYKLPAKQDQFLCARGLLRIILAAYLQKAPGEVHLSANPTGKPFLADQSIRFNLSHSGDYVLVGVSLFDRIGVDIEQVHPISNLDFMIRSTYSAEEEAYLDSNDPVTRLERFYAIWTAKEAYLKALGKGFTQSPKKIELLPKPGPEKTFRLSNPSHSCVYCEWTVLALDLPSRYRGAAAVDGQLEDILQIPLTPDDPFWETAP